MQSNADRCIARTIDKYEGGFDMGRADRGNWTSGKIGVGELKGTKYGICAMAYPALDIRNLTKAEAVAIYRRDYWPKVAGDHLNVGMDMSVYDLCVNSGSARALAFLRVITGVQSPQPSVLAVAANNIPDQVALIKRFNAKRRSFLIGLNNATFQRGWLRRVADVEAISVAWYLASMGTPAGKRMSDEKKSADVSSRTSGAAAVGAGSGGGAVGGLGDHAWLSWDGVIVAGVICAAVAAMVVCGYYAMVHRQRALAYAAAAKEVANVVVE